MRRFALITLLRFLLWVHGEELMINATGERRTDYDSKLSEKLFDKLVSNFTARMLNAFPSNQGDLDNATFGKPGRLALTLRTNLKPIPSLRSNLRSPLLGSTLPSADHSLQVQAQRAEKDNGAQDSLAYCSRRAVARTGVMLSFSGAMPEFLNRFGMASAEAKLIDTNEVVREVNGIKHKQLGNSDLVVSEVGLGTQRWGGTDFNSPDESLCHRLLDVAVENGINLVDTAEEYPIPSGPDNPEGCTEDIIGNWLRQDKSRRDKLVIATKITGGENVTPKNIIEDLERSLHRLGTDYVDLYLLHWPARYTPQENWGQSLEYDWEYGKQAVPRATSFSGVVEAMGKLMKDGKIRGYGACNDNAVGLLGMAEAAKELGVPGPCVMENDYSILNRRIEENGLSEASSPALANSGFFAYDTLAGGMLTGKYASVPAALDDQDIMRAYKNLANPRGRMDDATWGRTLIRYRTEAAQKAQAQYAMLAKEYGMSSTELAFRFAAGRPAVTSCLVGHTSTEQLEECLKAFRQGPLPRKLQWEIDRVHLQNRLPLFANTRAGSDWYNSGQLGERIP